MVFFGNTKAKALIETISTFTDIPHVLLVGPSGHGKSTLAHMLAKDRHLVEINANTIEDHNDVYSLLRQLQKGSVLFIDEIHALHPRLQESLYPLLDSFQFQKITGRGDQKIKKDFVFEPFILCAATTNEDKLNPPFKNRFTTIALQPYSQEDLIALAREYGCPYPHVLADYSRGTPRVLINLCKLVKQTKASSLAQIQNLLDMLNLFPHGLTKTEHTIMEILKNGRLSLNSLAAKLMLDEDVVKNEHEPYLLQRGFVERSGHGRELTLLGQQYFCRNTNHNTQEWLPTWRLQNG